MATEIDCTEARAAAKAAGRSFFLYYLYAVLRAVNEIREFRYRTDSRGNVIWHDTVDVISPMEAAALAARKRVSNASTPRRVPSSPTFRRTAIPTAPKRCCRRRAITTFSC